MNYAVILAGGVGTRFWPFSRELEPKQLIRVIGGKSLLQQTIARLKGLVPSQNIYIVTGKNYLYEIKSQTKNFAIPEENIIVELSPKNTAAAIGLCAKLIGQIDQDAMLVVLPADHYIKGLHNFRTCIKKAMVCAEDGFLVAIGIRPKKPATGYGYIKAGKRKKSYYLVEEFMEKPDRERAEKYFKDKRFFWNSGLFVWKASVFLDELGKYLPQLNLSLSKVKPGLDITRAWNKIKSISVDYGIMEHSKRVAFIPANFYWTDLGSWDALNEVLPRDKGGNIIQADCLNLDSHGVSVFGQGNRLISVIGLKDIIIADTSDALLVCDKDRAQEVRNIVQLLKLAGRKEHIVHTTEKRPWGRFTVLKIGMGFKVKFIEIDPKKRLSFQRHHKRAEHWVVISGKAKVTSGRKVRSVYANESMYIPCGVKHRLENPANCLLKVVEVQTGNYLEEDDIERFNDDFKR